MAVQDFLLTTDFPIEQVLFTIVGSTVVPNNTLSGSVNIPHGLPFTPLPIMVWSNTSDFAIANSWFDTQYALNSFTTGAGQSHTVSANATNITIGTYNFSGSSKTVYYQIYCLAPSDASIDSIVAATANLSENFLLNTDFNYMKLAYPGRLTPSVRVFNHNLGYVPRVKFWQSGSGRYDPLIPSFAIQSDPTGSGLLTSGLHVTATQLIWLNPTGVDYIEYRIYGDQ